MKCTKQKQHEIIVAIGKALNVGDLLGAEIHGKILKSYEEPAVRRNYHKLTKYEVIENESKLSKLTTTVYRCTYKGNGNYSYFMTIEEFAKQRSINLIQARKEFLNQANFIVEPIAEVFKEVINQVVFVSRGGKVIEHGFYLDIAFKHGIHFEDLNDCIEDRVEVKKKGVLYKFTYNDGKEV